MMALLVMIGAYLLGALSGSLILAPLFGRGDPRLSGSGNAGATNALRTGGKVYGASVLLFDVLKGVLAAALLPALAPAGPAWLAFACGGLAVVGHVWPVWFGFRGGKGAATLIGVIAVLLPAALAVAVLVWVATLVLTGFVGLATILGMLTVLLYTLIMPSTAAMLVFAGLMCLLVVYTHRENIARMRAGRENRFERVMLLRRGRRSS
ncbi:MAG: acyl-phosphate glycerol 3-phosphate acyltransferase [Salinisphaeraceae bacterium]|nr:acyl-phosphate glycerol 3-phosphate acyltransferase [Salinisphaeraceae bacterium]